MANIIELTSNEDWIRAFPCFESLRPNLTLSTFLYNRKFCQSRKYQLFGVEVDREIVAVAGICIYCHVENNKQLLIEDFCTHPKYLRKGYGKTLLDWIHGYAKQQECFRVKLDTGLEREPAHRLYEAGGLAKTGYRFEIRF